MGLLFLNLGAKAPRGWGRCLFVVLFFTGGWAGVGGLGRAEDVAAAVTVAVGVDNSGPDLAPGFAGLSYETSQVLPKNGKYYFDAGNKALVTLFQTLGVKSLRVGANAVDDPKVPIPQQEDLDSLFAFAKAAGVKVIYSFRLKQDANAAVPLAQYIASQYADQLDCFCIGNEPDAGGKFKTYDDYMAAWRPQYEAISAAVPSARFGGPSVSASSDVFAVPFVKEWGPSGKLAFVSDHHYFLGDSKLLSKDPAAGRESCLSDDLHSKYESAYDMLGKPAASAGVPYRLDETNSSFGGGALDISDTYAASLWALDYLHWWAARHTGGINFHTGDRVAVTHPPYYSAFITEPDDSGFQYDTGFQIFPLSYALLDFNLGAHGKSLPVKFARKPGVNFDAYAFQDRDSLYLTLINRSHAPVTVSLQLPATTGAGSWRRIDLTAPNDDISVKTGITVGGASIKEDGTWSGKWDAVDLSSKQVTVGPVSASVLVCKTGV
jgi:hypothetical protein